MIRQREIHAGTAGVPIIALTAGLGLWTSSVVYGKAPQIGSRCWTNTMVTPGGSSFLVRFMNNNKCEFREDDNDTHPTLGASGPPRRLTTRRPCGFRLLFPGAASLYMLRYSTIPRRSSPGIRHELSTGKNLSGARSPPTRPLTAKQIPEKNGLPHKPRRKAAEKRSLSIGFRHSSDPAGQGPSEAARPSPPGTLKPKATPGTCAPAVSETVCSSVTILPSRTTSALTLYS